MPDTPPESEAFYRWWKRVSLTLAFVGMVAVGLLYGWVAWALALWISTCGVVWGGAVEAERRSDGGVSS